MSPENTHKLMGFYMEVLHYTYIHTWMYRDNSTLNYAKVHELWIVKLRSKDEIA